MICVVNQLVVHGLELSGDLQLVAHPQLVAKAWSEIEISIALIC